MRKTCSTTGSVSKADLPSSELSVGTTRHPRTVCPRDSATCKHNREAYQINELQLTKQQISKPDISSFLYYFSFLTLFQTTTTTPSKCCEMIWVVQVLTFVNTFLLSSLRVLDVGKNIIPTAYSPRGGSSNPECLAT